LATTLCCTSHTSPQFPFKTQGFSYKNDLQWCAIQRRYPRRHNPSYLHTFLKIHHGTTIAQTTCANCKVNRHYTCIFYSRASM
jgi:hypothetical protein